MNAEDLEIWDRLTANTTAIDFRLLGDDRRASDALPRNRLCHIEMHSEPRIYWHRAGEETYRSVLAKLLIVAGQHELQGFDTLAVSIISGIAMACDATAQRNAVVIAGEAMKKAAAARRDTH